jgi:hypothetical protein
MTNDEEDSMSELYQSLSHSKWDCKYHVVFVPKRRRKAIFGQTRRQLGQIFHGLARQMRIPMKWGTDSGASGAASRQATLVTAIITEVPHFRQDFCAW